MRGFMVEALAVAAQFRYAWVAGGLFALLDLFREEVGGVGVEEVEDLGEAFAKDGGGGEEAYGAA